LFFNTPGRRKFLKSPARELSVIVETVQGLALAAPEAAFRLVSDGRELLWYPAERFRDRARRVLGPGVAAALDLDAPVAGGSLQGVLGTPQAAQPRRTHQWFLVNRRPVRSPLLARALSHAYHTLIPEDRYPAAVLAVRLPAAQVDANVHPRKAEVRFAQEGRVFEEVVREVGGALRRTALVHVVRTHPGPGVAPDAAPRSRPPVPSVRAADGLPGSLDPQQAPEDAAARGPRHATVASQPVERPALPLEPGVGWPRIRVLGQYALTYIVGESGDDLLFIDQHAAHERVLFERLLDRRAREGTRAQDLVTPAAVTLSPAEEAALEECRPALEEIGFGVEPFGPGLARLTAVPAIAAARAPDALFRACLQDLREESGRHAGRSLVERLAIATACHTAVRAGDRLDPAGIAALIEALARTDDPYSCFHGRPTMVRVPRRELDRWFYRRM
jgi:DNA mismatch repair protein MutL